MTDFASEDAAQGATIAATEDADICPFPSTKFAQNQCSRERLLELINLLWNYAEEQLFNRQTSSL